MNRVELDCAVRFGLPRVSEKLGWFAVISITACSGAGEGELLPDESGEAGVTLGVATAPLLAGAGKCMAAAGNASSNGTPVQLRSCNGAAAQRWKYRTDHGIELRDNQCLDIEQGQLSAGTRLQMWQCNGSDAQRWVFGADGQLHPEAAPTLCVDVTWGDFSDGTRLQLWDCNGTKAQSWQADDVRIVGLASKCIDVSNNATADGTPIQLWTCNGTSAQALSYRADHTLELRDHKCLDVEWGVLEAGTPIHLWQCAGNAAQRFLLGPAGQVQLEANPTLCLDVMQANSADGTRLQLWSCNGTAAQRWSLQNLTLSLSELSQCDDGVKNGDEVDVDCGGGCAPCLWGYADLHSHPAAHLAFGADADGNGLFWGKPGARWDADTMADDLAACASDKHSGFTFDLVEHKTRVELINQLNAITGHPHSSNGWPSHETWPHARSLMHQQMHVSWIHRAFLGGLRLMVASVVDNQVLAMLWNRHTGAGQPDPNWGPDLDFVSALRQIAFIKDLVAQNSDWMEIVTTPDQAERSIASGKLAVLLGVEMDQLSTQHLLNLVELGVRVVTPIHLVDNSFGGAAVYSDAFNTANRYLNGGFFDVVEDQSLWFRASSVQQRLVYQKSGAVEPVPQLNVYPFCSHFPCIGHRNAKGLSGDLTPLMEAGLLIDTAHMSYLSTEDALEIAEQNAYPLLNTHTGVRPAGANANSERELDRQHAARIGRLGGLIGFGTGPTGAAEPIADWVARYLDAANLVGRELAIGTDFNGMAEQISSSEAGVEYPFRPASGTPARPGSTEATQMFPMYVGSAPYLINSFRGGLAHYGMLPEFIEVAEKRPGTGQQAVNHLFRSAKATIDTWRKVQWAAEAMRR